MKKEITKMECINRLLEMEQVQTDMDCIKYLENEKALLLRKKDSKSKKDKEKEVADRALTEAIDNFLLLHNENGYTVTQIVTMAFPDENNRPSCQKVTHLLKKLVEDETVTKTIEKKTSYYRAVVDEVEEAVTDEIEEEIEE